MIPNNTITPSPITGDFIPPNDALYTPLLQTVLGGVAIGDASQGRLYQDWVIQYTGTDITVSVKDQPAVLQLPVAGVQSVSLAFDPNNSPVIAYSTVTGCNIRYYNGISAAYVVLNIPQATSCRVSVDCPAEFYTGDSDVIFAYTRSGTLYYRQERDVYAIEYTVGQTSGLLHRIGLSTENRFQFELVS